VSDRQESVNHWIPGGTFHDKHYPFSFLFCLAPLSGQVTTSALSGFVLDPTQKPIPNAKVVISNPARISLEGQAFNALNRANFKFARIVC
jgi:hypothetical protein